MLCFSEALLRDVELPGKLRYKGQPCCHLKYMYKIYIVEQLPAGLDDLKKRSAKSWASLGGKLEAKAYQDRPQLQRKPLSEGFGVRDPYSSRWKVGGSWCPALASLSA
jgi:hypothetical protein